MYKDETTIWKLRHEKARALAYLDSSILPHDVSAQRLLFYQADLRSALSCNGTPSKVASKALH